MPLNNRQARNQRINSASANVPRLVKDTTNYAYVNPQDAEELGVANGEQLTVSSAFGLIEVPVKLSDEMMRAHGGNSAVLGPQKSRRPTTCAATSWHQLQLFGRRRRH